MENKNLLLSVCIPTWNRANFLQENLAVLIPQIINRQNIIELIINDNASTDNTTEVVESYQKKYQYPILYTKRNNNIGSTDNFIDTINKAGGKYILLMGDDDLLSPNFFDIIIPLLERTNEYGIIHYNRLQGPIKFDNNKLTDTVYKGTEMELCVNDFIKQTLISPTFISSNIFLKEAWNKGLMYKNPNYEGYGWFWMLLNGLNGYQCLYYYFPLILQRVIIQRWISKWPLYALYELPDIFFHFEQRCPGIYKEWSNMMHNREFYFAVFFNVLEDIKLYRKKYYLLKKYQKGYFEIVISYLLIFCIPSFVSKLFYRVMFKIIRLIDR